jgi:hypothetical protein
MSNFASSSITLNTGQIHEENQRLNYLKKKGINFLEDDIGRTITYLQIPTNFSDQDLDSLVKLVAPVHGEVKFKDGVAWIYLKRKHAYPLWQQGTLYILFGISYLYTMYYTEEFLLSLFGLYTLLFI